MPLNVLIGTVLAIVLLFDFVYLPLERDRTGQDRAAVRADPAMEHRAPDDRMQALDERLAAEHARASALDRDLAAARDRLARAERDRGAADAARAEGEAELAQERRTATALADRLAAAQRAGAAQAEALATRLATEQARSATLESDLATARAESEAKLAEQRRTAAALAERLAAAQRAGAAGQGGAGPDAGLPDGMPARVVMLYRRGSEAARTRAAALSAMLRSQGLDVGEPVERPQGNTSNSITYYYDGDRGSAERIAAIVGSSTPIKIRMPKTGDMRPGRVDVSVAG